MKTWKMWTLSCLTFALGGGCALLSKGEMSLPRYFSPEIPQVRSEPRPKKPGIELQLGRVTAGSYIGEKIVFRETHHEVGFYDDRLWAEKPAAYLRRALSRVLFEEEGVRSILSGVGPMLDVELLNFEEVRKPKHIALIRLSFTLHDDRTVRMQQTLSVEKPIAPSDKSRAPDAVAEALGQAMGAAVHELSGRVLTQLSTPSR